MTQIRSSRWWIGLTAILATVFLGATAVLTFWGWPSATEPTPEPSPSAASPSPTSTGITHPAPLEARSLTESVLESVDDGWILVEYDSSAGRYGPPLVAVTPSPVGPTPAASPVWVPGEGSPVWEIPGKRYLYAVDPGGEAYEAAGFGDSQSLRLVLWLPDRRTAIVEKPVGGGVALYSFDLITGELSDRFPGPGGTSTGIWIAPDLRISRDGKGLLVVYREGNNVRGITSIEFDGTSLSTPVRSVVYGGFIQSADGTILVVAEGEGGSNQKIVSYAAPGTSIFPGPTPSGPPAAPPTATPTVTSVPPPVDTGYERFDHGLPAGEEECWPVSWPEGRQLLIACTHDDGAIVLYTLALMTSTFVDVTTVPFEEGEPFLSVNGEGARIARGSTVINVLGEDIWAVPSYEPKPTGLLWAGDFLVAWGDIETPLEPGFGESSITVRHSSRGDLAYVLEAIPGAAGFGAIVAAP